MAGVIIAVTIAGAYPEAAAAGRIRVIAGNPDPASADPFMMPGNPDRAAIRAGPWMLDHDGRGRRANLNADALGGSLGGTNEGHGNGEKRQECQTKTSNFHMGIRLDGGARSSIFFDRDCCSRLQIWNGLVLRILVLQLLPPVRR